LNSEFFDSGVIGYAANALIVALSPGYSGRALFRPWSPIATGNPFHRAEKCRNFTQRTAPLTFLFSVQAFRDPLLGELP